MGVFSCFCFFFSSRRRHTRWTGDWSSDVCSSDLGRGEALRDLALVRAAPYDGAVIRPPEPRLADLLPRLQAALGDRYTVERELGRGGMATVFLARDLKHDRAVAIKVLHAAVAATVGPERFQR